MEVVVKYLYSQWIAKSLGGKLSQTVARGQTEAVIQNVPENDAPVAILARYVGEPMPKEPGAMWRWYDGRLWTGGPIKGGRRQAIGEPNTGSFLYSVADKIICYDANTKSHRKDPWSGLDLDAAASSTEQCHRIAEWARNTIAIDGKIYRVADEPCYRVVDSGWAEIVGFTSVVVADMPRHFVPGTGYFPADRLDDAKRYCAAIASEHKRPELNVRETPNVLLDVIVPKAVQLHMTTQRTTTTKAPKGQSRSDKRGKQETIKLWQAA